MPEYQPDRGDIIFVNFTPQAGTEQAGERPGLVLSPANYNIGTGLLIACPITTKVKGSPFEVPLPRGSKVRGVVLANQIRSLDWLARGARLHSRATQETLDEVLARIEAIIFDS